MGVQSAAAGADESTALAEEWQRLIVDFNEVPRPPPSAASVLALIAGEARRAPDRAAIRCGRRIVTYGALLATAGGVADRLRSAGVGRGDVVALRVVRRADTIAAVLGLMSTGAAYLPIDPRCPTPRLEVLLEDSGARHLLSDLPDPVAGRIEVLPVAGDARQGVIDRLADAIEPDDVAYVIYTSGSTGQPKGVPITHRALDDLCSWYRWSHDIGRESRVLLMFPMTFDASVKNIITPLATGAQIILPEESQVHPLGMLQLIEGESVTHANCTPSALNPILRLAERSAYGTLRSLRRLAVGGEPTDLGHVAPWLTADGCACQLSNLYGPTECADLAVGCTLDRATIAAGGPAPLGRPIVNARVYLLDGSYRPVRIGALGELYIGGPGVAVGYVGRPRPAASRFVADPFHGGSMFQTGDLARWRDDGTLEFAGRVDDQLKVRGYRIEPSEIESWLNRHESVVATAVVAGPDDGGLPGLVAFVVCSRHVTATELRTHAAEMLPDYMIPARFLAIDALPLTKHGKVARKELHARAREPGWRPGVHGHEM